MEKLMCAVDIGGTKSLEVLFDTRGNIFAKNIMPGSTVLDIGRERCSKLYKDIVADIFSRSGGREISAMYVSCAACEHYPELTEKAFSEGVAEASAANGFKSEPLLKVEPDGLCLISAELGHGDGCGMISGTGSSFYVRHGSGWYREGGWGPNFGSCGSGFILACKAIRAAFRAYDGIDEPTLLSGLLEQKAGHPIWKDFDRLYSEGRPYVASFAGCVFEARKQGDAAACEIFDICSTELSELVTAARKREGKPLTVVMNGGIFTHFPEYAAEVRRKSPADTKFIPGSTPPVYGCAVEAMFMQGLQCSPEFRENFLKGLN